MDEKTAGVTNSSYMLGFQFCATHECRKASKNERLWNIYRQSKPQIHSICTVDSFCCSFYFKGNKKFSFRMNNMQSFRALHPSKALAVKAYIHLLLLLLLLPLLLLCDFLSQSFVTWASSTLIYHWNNLSVPYPWEKERFSFLLL